MTEGVNINVGTQGSDLRDNRINIGDVAGGNVEKTLSDYLRDKLKELDEEVKGIKRFLRGGEYGEPGLTAKVDQSISKISKLEKEISLVQILEAEHREQKLVLQEVKETLQRYAPMWESMYVSYTHRYVVPASVMWGFGLILFCAVVLVFWFAFSSRG